MQKNQVLTGTCSDYTHEGLGVVKVDGIPFFVRQVLVGEEIEFVVTKRLKSYGYGRCLHVLKPVEHRVQPQCPVYGKCGGCQLQHMAYEEQLRFKQNLVQNNMERIGKLDIDVEPTLGCVDTLYYRNKAQYPISLKNGVAMGFYRFYSNDIVDTDHCFIQSELSNQIMLYIKQAMSTFAFKDVFKHLLIKHAFATNEVMVVFIVKEKKVKYLSDLVDLLVKKFACIKSVVVNVNTRNDNVILGEEEVILFGSNKITDKLNDLQFNISSKSFYQVNPKQTVLLYETALQQAGITKEDKVVDLYCGVGTISLFLSKLAKEVIGIEIIPEAIEDAKINAQINHIDNVNFVCSDAATYAAKLVENKEKADIIVVDPPRKGCDKQTLESIVAMQPNKIVYISCNPATLARDLQILSQVGYATQSVQPVDMFPNTYHVETVVLMSRVDK